MKKAPPRIFKRDVALQFHDDLLPVIQNLTACGFQPHEIGQIVGFAGELSRNWLKELMKGRTDVAEAVKTGRILAQAAILARMIQSAMGYNYEEVDEYWVPSGEKKSDGCIKWALDRKTVKKRHTQANMQAILALANKFQVFKVNENSSEIDNSTETQLKALSGKLMDEVSRLSPKSVGQDSQNDSRESTVPAGVEPITGNG